VVWAGLQFWWGNTFDCGSKWFANKSSRSRVQNIMNRERVVPQCTRDLLAKYTAHATSASCGAVMDMDLKL